MHARGSGGLFGLLLLAVAVEAYAGNPRFITGGQYGGPQSYVAMSFYTAQPLYFTDPGALSSTVTHAQADAMVAAAAAVWNVPVASLTLTQGGTLAEHVSAANTYFNGDTVVFPADVQPGNYLSMPIAIVYDTDGSVTDLLLGEGASGPAGCRQNAVTESVTLSPAAGTIQHAMLLLNGRCVGTTPQQLLQMQYQLARAFGRVLGVGWSQLNDNVFVGTPAPTAAQMANWPLMHPIDIVCGAYTYQCMQNAFTLRPDDLSVLTMLYPVTSQNRASGKVLSSAGATSIDGWLYFPTLQGMEMVNMVLTRWVTPEATWEPWETNSSVTGYTYLQNSGNPVSGPEPSSLNSGNGFFVNEGYFDFARIPMSANTFSIKLVTEPINPLYRGQYALGPMQRPPMSISGPPLTVTGTQPTHFDIAMTTAASSCNSGADGSEGGPAMFDTTGWTTGLLCGWGHTSWWKIAVKANRTWTAEVTALDDAGNATVLKAQPVLGLWNVSDPTGTLPTVSSAPTPMNALALGMTQMRVDASDSDATLRLAIADKFGAGRPDFVYRARVLYADSVVPAVVSAGDQITILGSGFRTGNQVTVNGVRGTVLSWSANQMVALAPAVSVLGTAMDVSVVDSATGGSSVMLGALTYAAPVRSVALSDTSRYLAAGATFSWPLSLMTTQNGAPAQATPVTWSTTSALVSVVPALTVTNSAGLANTLVQATTLPTNSVSVVSGCAWVSICANWTLYGVDPSRWTLEVQSGAGQRVGTSGTLATVLLRVTDGAGHALPGATTNIYQTAYAWEGDCSAAGRCAAAPVLATSRTSAISDGDGLVTVTPLQVPRTAQTVNIAASAGTDGFVVLTLDVTR